MSDTNRRWFGPRQMIGSEDARRLYPSQDVNDFRALQVSAFNVSEACKTWVEHHFVTGQDPAPPMPEISHMLECLTKVLWKHGTKAGEIAKVIYGKPFVRNGKGDAADPKASTRSAKKSDDHGAVHVGGVSAKKIKSRGLSKKGRSTVDKIKRRIERERRKEASER